MAVARPLNFGSVVSAAAAHGHLYVLDIGSLAVYRFPLAADGLPAMKPDGTLEPAGAKDPLGLAVDLRGHVFLADDVTQMVTEFAAGASGPQEPISALNLPGDGPSRLRIDSAGRLYVYYGNGDGGRGKAIAIFAKGAQGNDYNPEGVVDYDITPAGTLYIFDWSMSDHIIGYTDPLDNPPAPDIFMSLQGGLEYSPGYSMTFDDATSQLYFQFYINGDDEAKHEYSLNFAARTLPFGGGGVDRMMFNGGCRAQTVQTSGAVISKQYLIVACTFDPELLVFRKDLFGHREAVEIIRGPLRGPAEIAIDP